METCDSIAIDNGRYGFMDDGFTGMIMWGDTDAYVADASFELCVRGGIKVVDFHGGTWKSGVWGDGIWRGGTWLDGTWRTGLWQDGTWYGGEWRSGIWSKGVWRGGVDNRKSPDPSMDCFLFHVRNGRYMCND